MTEAYELYTKGIALLDGNHPAQAALVLEKAKSLQPAKGSIREALGRAYYNYGQHEVASHEFQAAIDIDPSNHYAHFGLGLALRKLGRKNKALGHLKMALAMQPDNEDYQKAVEG